MKSVNEKFLIKNKAGGYISGKYKKINVCAQNIKFDKQHNK